MVKYKVWAYLEKIESDGQGDESYEDVSDFPTCIAEFDDEKTANVFIDSFQERSK